ncbi:30S ribosomal protein S13 [Candidatus Woesearchaeota archaeon]|nr:30S ribosomal protein S13 [Candidatus Woesearchaeota archaeon]
MSDQPLQNLIRLLNTDLDGNKQILFALRKIKGVGTMFANAILVVLGIDPATKLGSLSKEQLKKVEDAIKSPTKLGIPSWLFNRRKDPDTGEDMHLSVTELFLRLQEDIKMMKKIKCYKGVRHILGLPVRGQRTRSNFRKNKKKAKLGVSIAGKKKGGTT